MDVCSVRFTFERSLKQFLRRDVFAPIKFDNATIIQRVCIAGQGEVASQARFRDIEVGSCARRNFRNIRIFVYQAAKLISCFGEMATRKLLMRMLEESQRG